MRLWKFCNAERTCCTEKQRRHVSDSSANISSVICQDTPWSSSLFSNSRSKRDAGPRGTN